MQFVMFLRKVFSLFLSLITCTSTAVLPNQTPVKSENFRITAYIRDYDIHEGIDTSHFNQVTDFIIFGIATFDEDGNVHLNDGAEEKILLLKSKLSKYDNKNLYLSILGPGSLSSSDDWYEQMYDQAQRHSNAFESGILEDNIKAVLDKYELDGIFFDYEYPIEDEYWETYNGFIVSLDETLGDKYKIGIAVAGWDLGQDKQARNATDIIVLMTYDLWDNKGNHATYIHAIEDIIKCRFAGYDMSKVDLGLPFYARPTTGEGYWYAYNNYAEYIDESGLYFDSEITGLTFSFNTQTLIKEKTQLAIASGLGGVMVWHYGCDTPSGSGNSLFDTIQQVKDEATLN